MDSVKNIKYKNKEDAISYIIKKYLKRDQNIYFSEKLFTAKSIINWIFENSKHPSVIFHYMKDLEKYLEGTLELKWVDGIISKKRK